MPAARQHLEKVLASASSLPEQELRVAVGDFAQLYASDATNKDTLVLRARLIDAIGTRMQRVADSAEFDSWAALLTAQKKALEGDSAYASLQQAMPGWRAKVVAAEQARAEAERGELVLNAYPWGKVESVRRCEPQGTAVAGRCDHAADPDPAAGQLRDHVSPPAGVPAHPGDRQGRSEKAQRRQCRIPDDLDARSISRVRAGSRTRD